jgi:hypothetical protein
MSAPVARSPETRQSPCGQSLPLGCIGLKDRQGSNRSNPRRHCEWQITERPTLPCSGRSPPVGMATPALRPLWASARQHPPKAIVPDHLAASAVRRLAAHIELPGCRVPRTIEVDAVIEARGALLVRDVFARLRCQACGSAPTRCGWRTQGSRGNRSTRSCCRTPMGRIAGCGRCTVGRAIRERG